MRGLDNFFRRFLSIFSAKIVTTVLAILSTPIIVRLLGPGGYGNYAVLLSIFTIYMIPVSSGVSEGVQKYVAEERDHPHWRERVIRFYTIQATGFVLVGAGILLVVTWAGIPARLFGAEFTLYFYLLVLFVLISQFRALAYHTVLGFGLEGISEPLNILKKAAIVGLGIVFLLLGYGVTGMLGGHILANLIVAILAGIVLFRRISVRNLFGRAVEPFPHRELLSFNVLNIVLVFLVMSLFHVDVIMLRGLTGDETTGYYKAALQLAEYVWMVPMTLQLLLLHSSSTLWSEGRVQELSDLSSRLTRYTLLLVSLLALGLAVLGHRFVPLYFGQEFAVATLPMLLLLPGVVGFAAARPLQGIGQGSGQIKVLIGAVSVAATLNLVLNVTLIPLYGMFGAAIATSISYGSMFGLFVWASLRIGYNPLTDLRAPRILLTILVVGPPLYLMDTMMPNDLLAFLLIPPLGAGLYLLAAIGTGALDRSEVDTFSEKLRDPIEDALGTETS